MTWTYVALTAVLVFDLVVLWAVLDGVRRRHRRGGRP